MKYTSQAKQLTIDDFKSSLEGLSKSNRWVWLGDSLPWAKIEKLYMNRANRQHSSQIARHGCKLDRVLLLRQERDEVLKGTLSCPF